MKQVRESCSPRTVQDEREAYFAGQITTEEYLDRVLPALHYDRGLTEQFCRILLRLGTKNV